jgi:hypothetical protein
MDASSQSWKRWFDNLTPMRCSVHTGPAWSVIFPWAAEGATATGSSKTLWALVGGQSWATTNWSPAHPALYCTARLRMQGQESGPLHD